MNTHMERKVYHLPQGRVCFQTDSPEVLRALEAGMNGWTGDRGRPGEVELPVTVSLRAPGQTCPVPSDARLLYVNELYPGVAFECFDGEAGKRIFRLSGADVVVFDHRRGQVEVCASLEGPALGKNYFFCCVILPVLIEFFAAKKIYAFHGGAVSRGGQGVIMFGRGGSGKTTACLALSFGGFKFITDDLGLLVEEARDFRVLGISEPINLCHDTISLFPQLNRLRPGHDRKGKRTYEIVDLLGEPPAGECRPELVLFPEVRPEQETELIPLSRGEAVELLLPNGLFLTGMIEGKDRFLAFLQFIDKTRPMRLIMGKHLDRLAVSVTHALAASGGAIATIS